MPSLARGKSSRMLDTNVSFCRFDEQIIRSGQNSAITWRQAPQGVTGVFESAMIAMASKSFSPAAKAVKMALRSAQLVKPNEMFSILQPRNTLPLFVRRAAPIGKCEYGVYALLRTTKASEISD